MDRSLLDSTLAEAGEPAYRAGQVWEWVARGADSYGQMTNLPGILRDRLGPLAERVPVQEEPGPEPPRLIIHNDRARQELGWRPRPNIDLSIAGQNLLGAGHGEFTDVTTRTVDTHVKRLREKLGAAGIYVQTVRGVGYRFAERPDEVS